MASSQQTPYSQQGQAQQEQQPYYTHYHAEEAYQPYPQQQHQQQAYPAANGQAYYPHAPPEPYNAPCPSMAAQSPEAGQSTSPYYSATPTHDVNGMSLQPPAANAAPSMVPEAETVLPTTKVASAPRRRWKRLICLWVILPVMLIGLALTGYFLWPRTPDIKLTSVTYVPGSFRTTNLQPPQLLTLQFGMEARVR
jgi:uncharacterized membrane protein